MYFDTYRIAKHPELSAVCDFLIAEHGPATHKQSRFRYAMKVMVINLFKASIEDPLYISVNRKAWANHSMRHDHVRSIVAFLEANDYALFKRGYSYKNGDSRPSCLIPLPRLHELFERLEGMEVSYDVSLAPYVFLRDKNKKPMASPTSVLRHRMERAARDINTAIFRHHYTAIHPISDPKRRKPLECQQDRRKILFFLRRVFSRGRKTLTHGGRFYTKPVHIGTHPQGLPAELRATIEIDFEPTVELDFSAYHIHLLMALDGIQIEGDPYASVDAPRKDVKLMQLIAINAKTKGEALRAFKDECGYDGLGVYDAIVRALPALGKHFGSDRGILLQRVDSDVAEMVMLHFAKDGRACIPIHDSFIVKAKYEDELRSVMDDSYKKITGGFSCPIK